MNFSTQATRKLNVLLGLEVEEKLTSVTKLLDDKRLQMQSVHIESEETVEKLRRQVSEEKNLVRHMMQETLPELQKSEAILLLEIEEVRMGLLTRLKSELTCGR